MLGFRVKGARGDGKGWGGLEEEEEGAAEEGDQLKEGRAEGWGWRRESMWRRRRGRCRL